jgi:hypothetical protein
MFPTLTQVNNDLEHTLVTLNLHNAAQNYTSRLPEAVSSEVFEL